MKDDMILKIKKLLALSKSSNEHESQNAMIMAQKLLIKHKISMNEVDSYDIETFNILEKGTSIKFRGSSWKSNLGQVIANNFSCYLFYRTKRTHEIIFYGKEEDIIICNIMLEYAIKCINLNADKLIKRLKTDKRRKHFKGIKNDYAIGFINGLDERFKEQLKSNKEWGLVIVKDPKVVESYKEYSQGFVAIEVHSKFDKNIKAFEIGKKDGKEFDISNKLENESEEKQNQIA